MNEQKVSKVRFSSPVQYSGNLFILIVCLVLFLPLGIVLFLHRGSFVHGNSRFKFKYHRHWGWLYFWSIVCFPVMILLLALNDTQIVQES